MATVSHDPCPRHLPPLAPGRDDRHRVDLPDDGRADHADRLLTRARRRFARRRERQLRIPAEGFTGSSSQVVENACHFTHFFVSDRAAEEWARGRDRMTVVSIDRAFELAGEAFAANLVVADR